MKAPVVNRILVGVVGTLFAVGLILSMMGGASQGVEGSVLSSEEGGRRVLYLLLEQLGFEPRSWRMAPVALPTGEHQLWMPGIPKELELPVAESDESPEEPEVQGTTLLADPRHPANYGEFVRSGGTLLMPFGAATLEWLREETGLEVPDWEPCEWSSNSLRVELDSGEVLELRLAANAAAPAEWAPSFDWDGREHAQRGWRDLANAGDGRPFASWIEFGHGRLVLVGHMGFLRNESIGAGDNGLFCTRLVEALDRGGELYFDEYALGLWVPTSKGQLLLLPGVFEVTYHALLLLLLFGLFHAWAREFPRDPAQAALDPRLRVLSQARLFERAKRFDLLAQDLRLGVLRRIVKLEGVPLGEQRLSDDHGPEEYRALVMRIGDRLTPGVEGWSSAFLERNIDSAKDLESLAGELDELEKSVARRRRLANTGPSAGRRTPTGD